MQALYRTWVRAAAVVLMVAMYAMTTFGVSVATSSSANAQRGRGGRGGARGGRGGGRGRGRGGRRWGRGAGVAAGVAGLVIGGIIANEAYRGRCARWRRSCRRGNDWACGKYERHCD